MIYLPLLEKIITWVKQSGGIVYWIWVIIVGLIGAVGLRTLVDFGWENSWRIIALMVVVWIFGGILVGWIEGKRRKNENR